MNENQKAELKKKLVIGGTAAVVLGVVILEKRRVDNIVRMSQEAVEYTMQNSFESGVEYGLKLAQKTSAYAFSAFDKPAQ